MAQIIKTYDPNLGQWVTMNSLHGNYIFIKYADQIPTSNADMKDEISTYIGIYNGSADKPPTSYNAYQWYCLVGPEGPQGIQGEIGPQGETGDSGVYYGNEAPTDPNVNVWVNSEGDAYVPVANVKETSTGATITVTDYNGTTSVDIKHGEKGDGLPSGGTEGQILYKQSETDYDYVWHSMPITVIPGFTLSSSAFSSKTYTLTNSAIKTSSLIDIYYNPDSLDEVETINITYTQSNGQLVFKSLYTPTKNIVIDGIKVVNLS